MSSKISIHLFCCNSNSTLSLFEITQDQNELVCDASHDLSRDIGIVEEPSSVHKKESPTVQLLPPELSPQRPKVSHHTPLLTSTPHSLPPVSRNRVSSTPCAPPSPLNLPYTSSPSPLDSTDGPMSLPAMSNSGSKAYDYLLKVSHLKNYLYASSFTY